METSNCFFLELWFYQPIKKMGQYCSNGCFTTETFRVTTISIQYLRSLKAVFLNCRDAFRYRDFKAFLPGVEIFLKL